jgi:hypothetical protein
MRCYRHPGSRVRAYGSYETASGPRRRYECVPTGGERHYFVVAEGGNRVRVWTPPPECSEHSGSVVVRNGTYGRRTPQPRQRYRCTPPDGGRPHSFTPALPRDHVHALEGSCPECEENRGLHHGETAVARRHSWPTRLVARGLNELSRGGSYADVSRQALRAAERIAYRHEELVRGGLTAFEADIVVDAEEEAADHGAVSLSPAVILGARAPNAADDDAVEDRSRYRRRRRHTHGDTLDTVGAGGAAAATPASGTDGSEPDAGRAREAGAGRKRRRSSSSAASANAWHIAAGWTEAFAPVVFDPRERTLRAHALAERARLDALRAAGQPLDQPQVLLLDDVPVYGRDRAGSGRSRRDDGFYLLVAAELAWPSAGPADTSAGTADAHLRLRLVRAMPKSNAAAWRLLLDELGYHPDFVVADAGTGIGRAVGDHFDPARTVFVPSLWHVATAVRNGLASTRGALVPVPGGGREPLPELRRHLARLARDRAIVSVAAWTTWWDELEHICVVHRLPLDRVRQRRRNYEMPFATAITALVGHPAVPVSTGGLETLIARQVKPLLAMRRTSFANLERTNLLFDLVIAREHGVFDDVNDVVRHLREDATAHGGWTVPLRALADPRPDRGRYSSLRDSLLITELAEKRGLV